MNNSSVRSRKVGQRMIARNAPVALAEKLRELIRRCGMSRNQFIMEFAATEKVKELTVRSWLPESDSAPPAHLPLRGSQKKIIKYFSGKLGSGEFPLDVFYWTLDEFSRWLAVHLQRTSASEHELCIPLAGKLDPLLPAHIEYLCGTYRAFRYSLIPHSRKIVAEIVIVRPSPNNLASLSVEMLCVPANPFSAPSAADTNASTESNTPAELFVGSLCKYGDLFHVTVTHYNDNTHDKRIRCLQFPVLKIQRLIHYGLAMGYSVNRDEPTCARILAFKVHAASPLNEKSARSYIRTFDLDDPEVSGFRDLLENRLPDGEDVLSVAKMDDKLQNLSIPWITSESIVARV
jgi:hypothetical protein